MKTEMNYTGQLDCDYGRALLGCDANGPLLLHVTKLLANPDDATRFDALGRVMSGTVTQGQQLCVMGETYSDDDEEEVALAVVSKLYLPVGRYRVEIESASAGMLVLLEGVDEPILKTATLCDNGEFFARRNNEARRFERPHIFRPLAFGVEPVFKVAIEPLHPSELPKMLDGLRKINKSYLLSVTKKEERGEHTLIGTGELHLDCILRDLREKPV